MNRKNKCPECDNLKDCRAERCRKCSFKDRDYSFRKSSEFIEKAKLNLPKDCKGDKNGNYGKFRSKSYTTLHNWILKNKPKPLLCERCHKENLKLEASNNSGEYLRDINDYEFLCRSCHRRKDNAKKGYGGYF